jgi:hypothetical protein
MPKIINFETPSSYQSTRQLDSDLHNQKRVRKIFSDFTQDKSQEGRKKNSCFNFWIRNFSKSTFIPR